MRAISYALVLMFLGLFATRAEAHIWRHRGFHGYRHVGFRHYGFRSYGYRHVGYRHYGYRSYGYRHYGYRHFAYSYRPYVYGYRYYAPVRAYAPPVYYYPSYNYGPWGCVQSDSQNVIPNDGINGGSTVQFANATQSTTSRYANLGRYANVNSHSRNTASHVQVMPLPAVQVSTQVVANRDLTDGDALFRDGDYRNALLLYDAAARSKSSPEIQVRRAQAFVAMKRYHEAVAAYRNVLQGMQDLTPARELMASLYQNREDVKGDHVESLAKQALAHQQEGDYLFLVGMMLDLDGEAPRAAKFFAQAKRLDNNYGPYVARFLPTEQSGPVTRLALAD